MSPNVRPLFLITSLGLDAHEGFLGGNSGQAVERKTQASFCCHKPTYRAMTVDWQGGKKNMKRIAKSCFVLLLMSVLQININPFTPPLV